MTSKKSLMLGRLLGPVAESWWLFPYCTLPKSNVVDGPLTISSTYLTLMHSVNTKCRTYRPYCRLLKVISLYGKLYGALNYPEVTAVQLYYEHLICHCC